MYENYSTVTEATYDLGLKRFMQSVFNNMALGLTVTGLISYFIGTNPELLRLFFGGPQMWIVMLAPVGIVLLMSFTIDSMSVQTARVWFYVYAAAMGISLSSIFAVFTGQSITQVFFITATMFGVTSLYGYTTKKDLTGMGNFLIMGLIGLVVAGVVNIFLQSSVMHMVISFITVLVFTGLTAWDVQKLKSVYYDTWGEERDKLGIMGALNLYMDFVNIFINLLQLIGVKNND